MLEYGYNSRDSDLAGIMCKACGQKVNSEEHRTYYCRVTQEGLCAANPNDKHNSQYASRCVDKAKTDLESEGREHECTWLRGLIPLGMLPEINREMPAGRIEGDQDALCDGAEIYSDGTPGKYAQTANLRDVGLGWCIIDAKNEVLLGEYGLLEGEVQTVPRPELRALLSIFTRAPPRAKITIRVDASYLLGLREDPESKARADNGDMWSERWRIIMQNGLRVDIIRIPRSHATDALVEAGVISERDRIGN